MGLSRLSNFIKSVRGTILYVDPNSLDSTDSIENSGNSLTRPFKTLQRALAESVKFSYQRGQNNDRFNKTTILLYPGDHIVDNRPGYIVTGAGTYSTRDGITNLTNLNPWDLDTIFDLTNSDNALYKLNSVHGGIIIPRGVSIVGMDLRKTKIRPLYVPNPENDNIERSCIFRVTGGCYFWQFTILDSDPNGNCYYDYTNSLIVPNFSHHKLTAFEYADGVNGVYINDTFLNGVNKIDTTRTDLDMYYEKIAAVYTDIAPNYGFGTIDIQPVVDEYRIVGSKGLSVGISSIRAGGGTVPTATTTITVDLQDAIPELSVDTPIQISGINADGYDGQYVVSSVINSKQISYKVQNVPTDPKPTTTGSNLSISVDTVTSASPYIFNISLRSVYGMCGLLADGDKATGFKSMVVAQYTGIGLQKDDNAFVKYDETEGKYKNINEISNLHTNSRSRFKPEYENYHIKATNDAFLQLVSIFAIGYAQHFVSENGGDIALNNSNSNFGSKALVSSGFKRSSFNQDDHGYITHIIPPKEIEDSEISVEFISIDVGLTTSKSVGAATTDKLYLYNETDFNSPPQVIVDGYHVGAKINEKLNIQSYQSGITTVYTSTVVMPYGNFNYTQSSSEKVFVVGKNSVGINSIGISGSNVITLSQPHSFLNGETIRIISDNGHLPDGINNNQIYYAITNSTLGSSNIKIAKTLNDALNSTSISLNSKGGTLSIVSRVSDKNPGDIGHPIQWDSSGNWYVNVSTSSNGIYDACKNYGTSVLGESTSRSFIKRRPSTRSLTDTLYRVRYVIPKDSTTTARPPIDGFILQESNNILGTGANEISQLYNSPSGSISKIGELRNPKFISSAVYSSGTVTIQSEEKHNLNINDTVEILNVTSTNNTTGAKNLGYNGTYSVKSIVNSKEFTYELTSNPGTFTNNTSARNESLPYFKRKKYNKTYQVYRTQEVQAYVPNVQDGIYYLTLINHSNYPTVSPFSLDGYSQPIINLYPQVNKDNPKSDPNASKSHALPNTIGQVVVNDFQNSITKETLESFIVGYGITDIKSSTGTSHTIYTAIDHGFSGITSVSIVDSGAAYGSGSSGILYNAKLVGFAGSTTGYNATAKITLGSGGEISSVEIIDRGSAYGIGNTLSVVGVATTTGHVVGVIRVESIADNVNDTIQISGITSYTEYNNLYRISNVGVGKSKEIDVISSKSLSQISSSGIGSALSASSGYLLTGKALSISSFDYDITTGIATIGFTTSHGFSVNQKLLIGESNETFFNTNSIVKKINSLTSLVASIGIGTDSTTISGSPYAYRPILTSCGGELINDNENISGRLNYEYDGITAILGTSIFTTSTISSLNILNAVSLGFTLGDFILINNEIFRISSSVVGNTVSVLRSVLGSPKQTHVAGSVIRKIKVTPVELRRNSIIRASGHTFEYLGFGPGNYSTSLPEKQDRSLSLTEKFLAQSTKTNGGIVVYTGMNSDGDFFAGNKKINSATGKEETFDTPIPTYTGEKEINNLVNITETQKLFVTESLKVDGGKDKNTTTEFDGPVLFNKKISSNNDIESKSILLQGDEIISRKISISNTKPTKSGSYGDFYFNASPKYGDNVGWVYTLENEWESWGWINNFKYGVGVSSNSNFVGLSTLINFVGSGITITASNDSLTGITTVNFDANPKIGVSSGVFNTFIGNATQLNFVGYGITVETTYSNTGIATITINSASSSGFGSLPGLPNKSIQYNNSNTFSGVPIFLYDDVNNSLLVNGSSNNSIFKITQSGTGDSFVVEDSPNDTTSFVINNNGSVGIGVSVPTSKIDVYTEIQAINVTSLNGSGNIVRINNQPNDTTPFIIDVNGNVGINTISANGALDVAGNVVIVGNLRLYESDRSNYVGFQVGSLSSNLTFILPTSYGSNGQVLTTNGSGELSWTTPSIGNQGTVTTILAGTGITVTNPNGPNVTVTNTGITSIVAGTNVTVTKNGTVATISASTNVLNLYPFTTRGFSMLI